MNETKKSITKEYAVQKYVKDKYGLFNIDLNMRENIEMPYYSVPFADKKFKRVNGEEEIIEYTSYWKVDQNKKWEETLAKKMLEDPGIIITKNTGVSVDGHYLTRYGLTYYDKNCLFFKPSIQYKDYDFSKTNFLTLEFLFVFEDGYVFPLYKIFELSKYYDSFFKMSFDSLKDFKYSIKNNNDEFFISCPGFSFDKKNNELSFVVSSEKMGNTTLTFRNDTEGWDSIKKSLVSIRIVEIS